MLLSFLCFFVLLWECFAIPWMFMLMNFSKSLQKVWYDLDKVWKMFLMKKERSFKENSSMLSL
jgi:hypothetical protein